MSDILTIEHRVGTVESDVRDLRERVGVVEDDSDGHETALVKISTWRDGNGARGAEARLQEVEKGVTLLKECLGASQTDEAIERIASAAARSIVKGARDRDKTTVERVKAVAAILSPILSAGALIAAAVIAAVAAS